MADVRSAEANGEYPGSTDAEAAGVYQAMGEAQSMTFQDRVRGALFGLACGDAVGTTVEFKPPGSFEPVTDMTGGGPFELRAGEYTDDTAMALCLAESIVETGGFDPDDQMQRYVRWMRDGHLASNGSCFDIGNTTREALNRYLQTGEPFSGPTHKRSAGNGSLMRLAPVALAFCGDIATAVRYCGESSRTTHGARVCIDACRYFGALLCRAASGEPKEELLDDRYARQSLPDGAGLAQEVSRIASGSFLRKDPPEIRGTGYVVASLEAALWAFARSRDFREGCLLAVNLGDDADTTAAVYGQIAGAYYGYGEIPQEWRQTIANGAVIARLARGVAEIVARDRGD